MRVKTRIKVIGILLIQHLLHIFCIFPLNRQKIFFCSFDGKQYSDSPKYISEYYSNNTILKQVWAFDKDIIDKIHTSNNIIKVKKYTPAYFYHFFTSKEIVVNDFISTALRLRRKQVLLNTWHGGGSFKTVGLTSPYTSEYDKFFYKIHAQNTTAYVLSSEFFGTAVVKNSFNFDGIKLRTGMPRNSCLFERREDIKKRVERYYQFDNIEKYTIVLYAPTFRDNDNNLKGESEIIELDVKKCCEAIADKFNKPVKFIFRAHHMMGKDLTQIGVLDGTSYPDIQDLIYCSDILISDYSSCMWDFAIMQKPVIQYTPDLNKYIKNRNFLLPIREWNFIISENNDELECKIREFNYKEYIKGLEQYLKRMKSYENVNATKMVCKWLDLKRSE